MSYKAKLEELGLELPPVAKPVAAYVPAVKDGNYVFTSGQMPMIKGELTYVGKLGKDLMVEHGYAAAKTCILNALAAVVSVAGDIDNIEQIIKVTGFVQSAEDFHQQPAVINGASELLVEIFGDAGKHARSAVGTNALPLNAAVEIEMIVKVK